MNKHVSRRDFFKGTLCACAATAIGSGMSGIGGNDGNGGTILLADELAKQPPVLPLFPDGQRRQINASERVFHISATCEEILQRDETGCFVLPELWRAAGITDVWLFAWHRGDWQYPWSVLDESARTVQKHGMTPHLLTVPFGHPSGTPDAHQEKNGWKPATRPAGNHRWGVCCHVPADQACVNSVREIANHYGPCSLFLDDDFRMADTPADIGGCICPECRADFQKKTGYTDAQWDEMLRLVLENQDTPQVRTWVDYWCDRLTKVFRDTETASPEVDLGIMVMGMGSERAGIRLDDYRGKLFRVGEWMFTDYEYNPTKNKTIELFSVLMHRRFADPGRAFSETTIIKQLSAENYASKLVMSTFSDTRNTMFMCPIPTEYWAMLTPRVQQERRFHQRLVGQKAKGPFKHFWGLADRYMAGYDAYSLFLALGVPFEVCDQLPADGWTFLGNASAAEMDRGVLQSPGTRCVARSESKSGRFQKVDETFPSLFEFRCSLLPQFREQGIPYIEEETPVVLGWYPDARAMLVWNAEPVTKILHLRKGSAQHVLALNPLDSALVLEEADGALRRG